MLKKSIEFLKQHKCAGYLPYKSREESGITDEKDFTEKELLEKAEVV